MGADGSAYLHSMLMRQLLIWSSQYIPAGQHLNHHQIFVYVDKILSFFPLLLPNLDKFNILPSWAGGGSVADQLADIKTWQNMITRSQMSADNKTTGVKCN